MSNTPNTLEQSRFTRTYQAEGSNPKALTVLSITYPTQNASAPELDVTGADAIEQIATFVKEHIEHWFQARKSQAQGGKP